MSARVSGPALSSRSLGRTSAMVAIAASYVLLVACLVKTRLPWIDEAWVANPAWNLLHHGKLVTSFFDPANPDSNQAFAGSTYWMPPGWFLIEAGWFALFGVGLFAQRVLSAIFGAMIVFGVGVIARRLTQRTNAALLAAGFAAVDFVLLDHAADGRMDAAAAACLVGCYALYLSWREANLSRALLGANILLVLGGLIHPIAIVGLLGFSWLVFVQDRTRLRLAHLPWIAAPYLAGGMAWGAYILRDPAGFVHQFFGKTPPPDLHPIAAFTAEITQRYRGIFGFDLHWHIVSRPQFLVGLAYAIAAVVVIALALVRRKSAWTIPAGLWLAHFLGLTFLVALKVDYYLPTMISLATLVLALVVDALTRTAAGRIFAIAITLSVVAADMRVWISRVQLNPYRRYFLPALADVNAVPASERVSAPPEFAYALGFPPNVVHDYFFGYYSGVRPALIVLRKGNGNPPFGAKPADSAFMAYRDELFRHATLLPGDHGPYEIYRVAPEPPTIAR